MNLSFSFAAQGNGATPIELTVRARIKILFVTITKTASFKIGTLQLPEPVYLGGDLDNGRVWSGGALYLNVGDTLGDTRAARYRNISITDVNESYIIEDLGASEDYGRIIKVTGYGRSNTFENVTSIDGDFGSGTDTVLFGRYDEVTGSVTNAPTVPVTIDMGAGEDVIIYAGTGAATLNGGADADYIGWTGNASGIINGNGGGDYLVHIGDGSVTMNGDAGNDRIIGGNSTDVLNGGANDDDISGPAASITGGDGSDVISVIVSVQDGDLHVNAGSGTDTLNILGSVEDDVITVSEGSTQLNIAVGAITVSTASVESLYIDGGAGSDTITVEDMDSSGLQRFLINYGQRVTSSGFEDVTESLDPDDADAETVTQRVALVSIAPDYAKDVLTVYGGENDDTFLLSATGANVDTRRYTEISVARVGVYSLNVMNTVRAEEDALIVDADGGADRLDASAMGTSDTITTDTQTITIARSDQVNLTLVGGLGNDRLIGTPFDDILNSGDGNDKVTGGYGLDTFIDAGGEDTLIESLEGDSFLTDDFFINGQMQGDGEVQIVTIVDGYDVNEVQRITSTLTSGTFTLSYGLGAENTTIVLNANADPEAIENALLALSTVVSVNVVQKSTGATDIWDVTFYGPTGQAKPGELLLSANSGSITIAREVIDATNVIEQQRITHSGADGTFTLTFDDGVNQATTTDIAWNASAVTVQNALNALNYPSVLNEFGVKIGTVSVELFSDSDSAVLLPYTWKVTFVATPAVRGQNVLLLTADSSKLTPGGTISGLPSEAELKETSKANNPSVGIPDSFSRFAAGGTVESLGGIFEFAEISGSTDRNLLIVGSADGVVSVGSTDYTAGIWTGNVELDNKNLTTGDETHLAELYVLALSGEDGGRVDIVDTGVGSGRDELIILGGEKADTVNSNAFGFGSGRTGVLTFTAFESERPDVVYFRGIELVSIDTGGGDDNILSDDTAATTFIATGSGDDSITIGTVPLIPDPGNRTLEFPEGVPIADTDNMTNGASNPLFIFGEDQNDRFEVNFNRGRIYLHGGDGDDRFLLKTFLVLRENPEGNEDVTNLANVFGGTGSNRYEYLQNGAVQINGGPGVDTLVVVGTPIADTFVVTESIVAGAGRVVGFRNIEALEIDGAGGNDEIYVLSTNESFTTTIVGGSGDDTIHFGGDHPPLVFDPPAVSYTPPPIQVELGSELVYDTITQNFGDYTFAFDFGWWGNFLLQFSSAVRGSLIDIAIRAVENSIQQWFESWRANIPNLRNGDFTYGENKDMTLDVQVIETTRRFIFWSVTSKRVVVTLQNLEVSYERGRLVTNTATVQPPTVTIDPVPFAFKQPAKFDISDIRGRVIIDGGRQFEDSGDTVIFHNSGGPNTAGLITNRELPRYESAGKDDQGNTLYEQAEDENGPIVDTYLSVEGLGMDIPTSGFVGVDGVRTYGVLLKNVENLDLRLADETAIAGQERGDNLTVALTELRGAASRGDVLGSVAIDQRQAINLQIVGGAGDDQIFLLQTTGDTTIYGGAGQDTVTVGENGSLAQIGGGLIFDGDAHIDEVLEVVTGSDIPNVDYPDVFINTTTHIGSFQDAGGNTINYADANLQPILYVDGAGNAQIRTIAIRADGTIETDFVQDYGVRAYGVQAVDESGELLYRDADGLQTTDSVGNSILYMVTTNASAPGAVLLYIDNAGLETASALDGDGYSNRALYATDFAATGRVNLYLDSVGVKTAIDPSFLVKDAAGNDFALTRHFNSSVGFDKVEVLVSNNGSTWLTATRDSISGLTANYNVGLDNGGYYKYVRVIGVDGTAFRLEGLEILAGHGGPNHSKLDTRYPSKIIASQTTVNEFYWPAAVIPGDGLYLNITDASYLTYGASGGTVVSVINVDRNEITAYTRTRDVYVTAANAVDRLIIDGSTQSTDLIGALDRFNIGNAQVSTDGDGRITFNTGARVDEFDRTSGGSTVLSLSALPGVGQSIYIAREIGSNDATLLIEGDDYTVSDNGIVGLITLNSAITSSTKFYVNYTSASDAKTYFGGELAYQLVDPVANDLTGASLIAAVLDPLNQFNHDGSLSTRVERARSQGGRSS